MKILIIYAHPNHTGHHGYFLDQFKEKLAAQQADYEIIDLYALNYNPVLLDSELYSAGHRTISLQNLDFQKKIKEADRLVFIYPTWWQNMPAMLKGFIDRVFTGGFGFRYENGLPVKLLKGKKAAIFTASGGPALFTKFIIRNQAVRVLGRDVLSFSGIDYRAFCLASAHQLDNNSKAKIDNLATKAVKYIL